MAGIAAGRVTVERKGGDGIVALVVKRDGGGKRADPVILDVCTGSIHACIEARDDRAWGVAQYGAVINQPHSGWEVAVPRPALLQVVEILEAAVQADGSRETHIGGPGLRTGISATGTTILAPVHIVLIDRIRVGGTDLRPSAAGDDEANSKHSKFLHVPPERHVDLRTFGGELHFIPICCGFKRKKSSFFVYVPTWESARKEFGSTGNQQKMRSWPR